MTDNKIVVYVDLDGTLLGNNASLLHNSEGKRTNVSVDAMHRAEEAGIDLVIATGRDRYRASEISRTLGVQHFIAELGCVIKTTGEEIIQYGEITNKYIEEKSLSHEQFRQELSAASDLLLSSFPAVIEMHSEYNRDQHGTMLMRGNIDTEKANKLLKENGWPFLEVTANGHGMFRRTMPGVENVLIYHLSPIGINKATGIMRDQELRSLDQSQCFMIGDGKADVECSSVVNTVYVPSNGILSDEDTAQYVKDHENVIALDRSHNEGFAQAIDLIIASTKD